MLQKFNHVDYSTSLYGLVFFVHGTISKQYRLQVLLSTIRIVHATTATVGKVSIY